MGERKGKRVVRCLSYFRNTRHANIPPTVVCPPSVSCLHLSSVFDLCTLRICICVPYLPLRVGEEGRALPFKDQRLILLVVIVTDLMVHMNPN